MAIINCPECGKEISDKSETCIYCGYPLKETKSEETPKDETSEKVSIRNNLENLGRKIGKRRLFVLFGAVLVMMTVILISVISQNVLNEKEKWLFWHRCGSITSTFPYADREKPPLRILRFGNGIFRSEQYSMTM